MTEKGKTYNRPVIIAAVTATLMMFVFGVVHRTLAARLTTDNVSPMASDSLDKFPMQIGDWTGQDVPLDETVIEATDTDAHISRNYFRNNKSDSVWLYVAAGRRSRDLMPHRPEVCYIGSGWTRTGKNLVELPVSNGTTLPCNVFQFSKGALVSNRVLVLNYYLVDGQFCRDVSLLRSKIWQGSGMVHYVAQIQIVTPVTVEKSAETAAKVAEDFARLSALSVLEALESASGSKDPNTIITGTADNSGGSRID
jgi:EpsI family protein